MIVHNSERRETSKEDEAFFAYPNLCYFSLARQQFSPVCSDEALEPGQPDRHQPFQPCPL